MKFEVYEDFSVGAYRMWFIKTFELPFSPFMGMKIYDHYKGNELTLSFDNDEYVTSQIGWCVKDKKYYGQINHSRLRPHNLKEEYETHLKCGWKESEYNDKLEKIIEILEYK